MNLLPPPPSRRPGRWIAAIVVVVLAAGIAVAARQWAPRPAPPPGAELPGGDDPVAQALEDEETEKTRWIEAIPALDVSGLDEARQAILLRHANSRRCTCGCGYTLAACRVYDSSCDKSQPKVEALRDSIARGWIADADGLREPPRSTTGPTSER